MAISNVRLTEEVDDIAVYSVKSFNKIEVYRIEKQIVKTMVYHGVVDWRK